MTKPLTRLLLRASAAVAGAQGDVHVRVDARTVGEGSYIKAELIVGCRPGRAHRSLNVENAVRIEGEAPSTPLVWKSSGRGPRTSLTRVVGTAKRRKEQLRLRLYLCGDAKLFSFSVHSGLAPPPSTPEVGEVESAERDPDDVAEASNRRPVAPGGQHDANTTERSMYAQLSAEEEAVVITRRVAREQWLQQVCLS